MTQPAAPNIFAPHRRQNARRRLWAMQQTPQRFAAGPPRYLIDDMVEDVLERIAFLRHAPARALVVGDWTGDLARALTVQGAAVTCADPAGIGGTLALGEEVPYPIGGFDLIASLGTLDTVNDLPGALVHIRQALAPGGLAIVAMMGAGSLPALRDIMMAADGDRPAARMHPMVDVRAGAQLLQRVGWADPVADSRTQKVRFGSLSSLIADVRAQGCGGLLTQRGPVLGKAGWARAQEAFAAAAQDGRVTESFEILTLSGWRR
ncbi:methyltransferase domain-containing protein [Novosphingobium sp. FSY-8]|uniref:Methyltransferase domain-containing protein n=1 Tax=Novosphingobium ovatum TaxID=1908523 RepID=A0ABW9XCR1_9SPHN|nr:methyltransferase domain-containing protein [Novosphingobium ovatum]NBC36303.1 methyltransferase domain-containing protein [Novosphingobium ovatum]